MEWVGRSQTTLLRSCIDRTTDGRWIILAKDYTYTCRQDHCRPLIECNNTSSCGRRKCGKQVVTCWLQSGQQYIFFFLLLLLHIVIILYKCENMNVKLVGFQISSKSEANLSPSFSSSVIIDSI